jgi:putative spermidine/putrescine transport system substrate-binding protein
MTMTEEQRNGGAPIVTTSRRQFLARAGALGLGAAGGALITPAVVRAQGEPKGDLVVCVAGGKWETAFRDNMAKPFSERYPGVKVHLDLTAGTAQLAKLRASKGSTPPFDIVNMLDEQMDIAMREGLVETFDASEVPNVKDLYAVSTPTKWQKDGKYYSVHQNWGQLGITYRTDKVKTPPKEWADFWKPEYKGLIGMPPISYSVGLQFFIATIHGLGGDEKNPADVDRGFEKMKALRPSVAQQPADAGAIQQLLERGDVAIVPLWDGRAHALSAAGLPIGFSYPNSPGPVASGAPMAIVKGTKNRAAAVKMIDFRLSPPAQKGFCETMWYGPSNRKVKLDDRIAAKVAYGNEAYQKLLAPNYDVVSGKLGEWTQRWAAIFSA